VIARFVDIGGIDDHHCINFLFIMYCRINHTKHKTCKLFHKVTNLPLPVSWNHATLMKLLTKQVLVTHVLGVV